MTKMYRSPGPKAGQWPRPASEPDPYFALVEAMERYRLSDLRRRIYCSPMRRYRRRHETFGRTLRTAFLTLLWLTGRRA